MIRALVSYLPLALWAAGVLFVGAVEFDGAVALPAGADKVVHFLMYAVGGALAAWAGLRNRDRIHGWIGLFLVAATGAVDEVRQLGIEGRTGDVMDWVADVAGALFAFLLVRRIFRTG